MLIDGHTFDVPPAEHMLMVTNDDRPGVIGTVGTLLGDAGVNIADMDVGRRAGDEGATTGTAVMLIATGSDVDARTLDALRAAPGIIDVIALTRLKPRRLDLSGRRVGGVRGRRRRPRRARATWWPPAAPPAPDVARHRGRSPTRSP